MNKLQSAILWLAVLELIIACFFMPVFVTRVQEIELAREVQQEEIMSANLTTYNSSIMTGSKSGMDMDQKIDVANSYDYQYLSGTGRK